MAADLKPERRIVLAILDGWGLSTNTEGNAIALAQTPTMDSILSKYQYSALTASGTAIGLPKGQMGNSEVGHLNLGAGRTVLQDFLKINHSISNKSFYKNNQIVELLKRTKAKNGQLQVLGLVSNGGVHSHIEHFLALFKLARSMAVKVSLHAFLDGRDTLPISAKEFIAQAETALEGFGRTSSISGRYYSMDRDNRWDRVKMAYDNIVWTGPITEPSAQEALASAYAGGETDEFVTPTFIKGGRPIREEDGTIFMNFRPDRARQLTSALTDDDFSKFALGERPNIDMVTLTSYGSSFKPPVAYPNERVIGSLGEHISSLGLTQLRAAETEKYAHVTYFFSGGHEQAFPGEKRLLIPSPKVLTYDLKPEMSAIPLTNGVLWHLDNSNIDIVIMNYANLDMVGHTGDLKAAIKAAETVDHCLEILINECKKEDYTLILTADHGNAEKMIDPDAGGPFTAHTTNPVPFIVLDSKITLEPEGVLGDAAPTLLDLMGLPKNPHMAGNSLIKH